VTTLVSLLKIAVILIAAILIGNWYQSESKKIKAKGKPWYKLYLSPPGLLIVAAIFLPIVIWLLR
jgi:hypothetical protein